MSESKFNTNPDGSPASVRTPKLTVVRKGWGREDDGIGEVFAYHRPEMLATPSTENLNITVGTVKLLYIAKGKKLSRHYHLTKDEFFIIASGEILLELWDSQAVRKEIVMGQDQRVFIRAGQQHRMTGLGENNILLEVSTEDDPEDSYRIEKGD